jgi:hypothetical protein
MFTMAAGIGSAGCPTPNLNLCALVDRFPSVAVRERNSHRRLLSLIEE